MMVLSLSRGLSYRRIFFPKLSAFLTDNFSLIHTSYHCFGKPVFTVVSFVEILGMDCNLEAIICQKVDINPLNTELNPICYLLALLGAHDFLHVSRIRVK